MFLAIFRLYIRGSLSIKKKDGKKWLSIFSFTEKYTYNQNIKREIQTSREIFHFMDRTRSRKRVKENKSSKREKERQREENRVHVTPFPPYPSTKFGISFWRWISDRGSDGPDVSFRLSKSFQFLESRAFRPDWIISANAAWKRDSKRSRQYDKRQPPLRVHSWLSTPSSVRQLPSRDGGRLRDGEGGGILARRVEAG